MFNKNNDLNNYSDKLKDCYIEYEYFEERNKDMEIAVKKLIKRSKFINTLPGLFSFLFPKERKTLIRLANIITDNIEKNKNNMLELYSVFNKIIECLESIPHCNNYKLAAERNTLLKEYWEFKKLLDKQISISYDLSIKLQGNLAFIENSKIKQYRLEDLNEAEN